MHSMNREDIKKIILQKSRDSNSWIQVRSHNGAEYISGMPDLSVSEEIRQLSISAIHELVMDKELRLVLEGVGADIIIKLYDLSIKAFEDLETDAVDKAAEQILKDARENSGEVKKVRSDTPEYVQTKQQYQNPSRTRVIFLTALDELVKNGRLKLLAEKSSESQKVYSLNT